MQATPASPFIDPTARPLDPAKFRDPLRHRERRAPRPGRAGAARHALDQHRHALQPRLPELLYRKLADQRRARLPDAGRGRCLIWTRRAVLGTREIGFTGGEPFMNPEAIAMIAAALGRGFEVLVLTNAMRPMRRFEAALEALPTRAADVAGQPRSSQPGGARGGARRRHLGARRWTACAGSRRTASGPPIAGRQLPGESPEAAQAGYADLLPKRGPGRRGRSGPLPGDGFRRRRARDQHRLLGHTWTSRRRR